MSWDLFINLWRALAQSAWWVSASGLSALFFAVLFLIGFVPSFQKVTSSEKERLESSPINQTSNGANSPNIYAPNSTINLASPRVPLSVKLPAVRILNYDGLTVSDASGNPPSEYAKKFFKQHELSLRNENPFPLQSIEFSLQLPEPIIGTLDLVNPPGVNVAWRSTQSESRMTGTARIVGSRPAPVTTWSLSVDKIPANGSIRILFLTTNNPEDTNIPFFTRKMAQIPTEPDKGDGVKVTSFGPAEFQKMLNTPDNPAAGVVDFIEGTFQVQDGDVMKSTSIVTSLTFNAATRDITAEGFQIAPLGRNLLRYGLDAPTGPLPTR